MKCPHCQNEKDLEILKEYKVIPKNVEVFCPNCSKTSVVRADNSILRDVND